VVNARELPVPRVGNSAARSGHIDAGRTAPTPKSPGTWSPSTVLGKPRYSPSFVSETSALIEYDPAEPVTVAMPLIGSTGPPTNCAIRCSASDATDG
jgi:hypothetical protein